MNTGQSPRTMQHCRHDLLDVLCQFGAVEDGALGGRLGSVSVHGAVVLVHTEHDDTANQPPADTPGEGGGRSEIDLVPATRQGWRRTGQWSCRMVP